MASAQIVNELDPVATPNLVEPLKSAIERAGFMLLLPDAIRLGLWDRLDSLFQKYSVEIVAVIPLIAHHQRYIAVYRTDLLRQNEPDRLPNRWMAPNHFALDMSIAVLMRSSDPAIELQTVIRGIKGKRKSPEDTRETIRDMSPLAFKCFSIVHAPDHAVEMERQSSVFFDPFPVAEILGQPQDRRLTFQMLEDLRGYVELASDPHPYDLWMRTLQRAVATLAWDGRLAANPEAEEALGMVRVRREEMRHENRWTSPVSARAALADLDSALASVPQPRLRSVSMKTGGASAAQKILHRRTELHTMVRQFTQPDSLNAWHGPDIVDTLMSNELFLDPWEQHRLLITAGFF